MNNAKKLMISIACCMFVMTGCRTAPKATYKLEWRKITVLSEPKGATVTQLYPFEQRSRELGETPLYSRSVLVMTDITFNGVPFSEAAEFYKYEDNAVLIIKKDGYQPYRATINTKPDSSVYRKCVLKTLPTH